MKFFFISLILISTQVMAQVSYVPQTQLLRKKGYEIRIEGDFFTKSKGVDADGKKQILPDGESFHRYQTEFSGFYGATDDLQFGAGIRLRQNTSTRIDDNNTSYQATESGLQSSFLSLKYSFRPLNQLRYTLEGFFRYTPYTNEDYDSTDSKKMILGDDGNEYSAGLGVTYSSLNKNFLTIRGGYRKPGIELSPEIYWQVEGALTWKYLGLVAGVDGVSSIHKSPYESSQSEQPVLNTQNTYLYNSFDRDWIAPYLGFNLALGKAWRMELKGSQTVSGRSTDLGTTLAIAIVRREETTFSSYSEKRFKSYDIEGNITKVSPKKEYVVIDKGLTNDVTKGMNFDFFEFDYVGGNVLVARGVVIQVKSETAIVKLTQRYDVKKDIKEGLVARGMLK